MKKNNLKKIIFTLLIIGIVVFFIQSNKITAADENEVICDLSDTDQTVEGNLVVTEITSANASKNFVFTSSSKTNTTGIAIQNNTSSNLTCRMTLRNCTIMGENWNSALKITTKVGTTLNVYIFLEGNNYLEGYNWGGITIGDSAGTYGTVNVIFASKAGTCGTSTFTARQTQKYALQVNTDQVAGYSFAFDSSITRTSVKLAGSVKSSLAEAVSLATAYKPLIVTVNGYLADFGTETQVVPLTGGRVTVPSYVKPGYTLRGYYIDGIIWDFDNGIVTSDLEFQARWDEATYNINYHLDGGTLAENSPTTHKYGGGQTNLISPTKFGYNFMGWYKDENLTQTISYITSYEYTGDIELYAKWTVGQYQIYYTLNGGTQNGNNPTTYTYGIEAQLYTPTKTGYTFEGWCLDYYLTTEPIMKLEADGYTSYISLYAKWTAGNYNIKYNNMENAEHAIDYPVKHYYGTVTALLEPTKSGYTFEGWFTNASLSDESKVTSLGATDYEEEIELYTKWIPTVYTITFDSNDGSTEEDIVADFESTIILPTPTKTNFTFEGWYTDNTTFNNKFTGTTMPLNGATLYAKWEPVKYNINYNNMDAATHATGYPVNHIYGFDTTLMNPTKEGYTFVGWFTNSSLADTSKILILGGTNYSSEIELYAKWTINQYTITFVSNGGTEVNSITVDYNSVITLPSPTRANYSFSGWFSDNTTFLNQFTSATMPFEGATLYAKWSGNSYTISYELNAGTPGINAPANHIYGTITTLVNPSRLGYNFDGWYTSFDFSTSKLTVLAAEEYTENIALYAKWIVKDYQANYDLDNGANTPDNSKKYNYGDTIELEDPTKIGYTFNGWYNNSNFTGEKIITLLVDDSLEEITLYAKWTINSYTITLDIEGITTTQPYNYNTNIIKPTDPIKEGYRFLGWYVGTTEYNFTAKVTKDVVLTAKFIKQYVVTFDNDGEITTIKVDEGAKVTKPENPKKNKYKFNGWIDETGAQYDFEKSVNTNFTITAQFKKNTNNTGLILGITIPTFIALVGIGGYFFLIFYRKRKEQKIVGENDNDNIE